MTFSDDLSIYVSRNKGSREYTLKHRHMNLLKIKIKPSHDLEKGNKITKRNVVELSLRPLS